MQLFIWPISSTPNCITGAPQPLPTPLLPVGAPPPASAAKLGKKQKQQQQQQQQQQ